MPIYEYVCLSCGKKTEVIQKFSDAPLATCEDCSGELKKLLSKTSFQLKGGGWYATDYKKSSSSDASTKPEPGVTPPADPPKKVE